MMSQPTPNYRGRFAPSPTGPLHFGAGDRVAGVPVYNVIKRHTRDRVDDCHPEKEVPDITMQYVVPLTPLDDYRDSLLG